MTSNLPRLKLHIPTPPARPGEPVDFSRFDTSAAGEVPRPDSAAREASLRDIPYRLIRVLDDDGRRSEEHTSELQSLMRISYAVFCLKKKTKINTFTHVHHL